MGNPKEQGESSAKRGDSRKRLRESGSQTDDDSEHMEPKLSTSHCLDAMNAKLDELLATCSEIKTLAEERNMWDKRGIERFKRISGFCASGD